MTTPTNIPIVNGGDMAWATRRVGGDQNGSASFNAWRRTSRNDNSEATTLTPIQNPANDAGRSIFTKHAAVAAAIPITPHVSIMGASARRYSAERSMSVRMTCRWSVAQLASIRTLYHKA